jgi:hypothetical protein
MEKREVVITKVSCSKLSEALTAAGARTYTVRVRKRILLEDFDAEMELEVPLKVFFSEKQMVAIALPQLPSARYALVVIGSDDLRPKEFKRLAEQHIGCFKMPPSSSFKAPLIVPLDRDARINITGWKRLLEWSSRFDARELFFINTWRRLIYHEYENERTGTCFKHLILYNTLHSVDDLARAVYSVLWVTRDFLPRDVESAVKAALGVRES